MTPRAQLRSFIAGRKQFIVAKSLGVAGATLSLWLSGKRRPDHPYRVAIERYTDGAIPAASWATAAERRAASMGSSSPKSAA